MLYLPGIEITIRQARASDAPVIVEFNRRLALETEKLILDPQELEPGVAAVLGDESKGIYFVAEVGGQIAGQVMITYEWSDWRNGNLWWIQSVFVKEEFRRSGIFRGLFEHLCQLARQRDDVCGLRLYMKAGNDTARRSYERLGMKATGYEVLELDLKEPSDSESSPKLRTRSKNHE